MISQAPARTLDPGQDAAKGEPTVTLPNFLVIGAPKAGTTSLHDYLRAHPQVYMAPVKAARFFCYKGQTNRAKYPAATLADYEALFAGVRDETAIGEATAIYLEHPDAAARAHAVIPKARIVAILREPVQRAFSIHQMNLRDRGTNAGKDFLAALRDDPALRRLYHEGLAPWYAHYPREAIKVMLLEDLRRDAAGAIRELFGFLGVDPDFVPELKVSNPGGVPRLQSLHGLMVNRRLRQIARAVLPEGVIGAAKDLRSLNLQKREMTEAERAGAYPWFAEDIRRTETLIARDLSAWRREDALEPA